MIRTQCTHHELELVHVLGLAVRVLDLLGEHEAHLEQEQVALASLLDERLRVPHVERVLQQHVTHSVQILLQSRALNRGEPFHNAEVVRKFSSFGTSTKGNEATRFSRFRVISVQLGTYLKSGEHAEVHGVVRTFRDIEHHFQPILQE